jgi:hypothetical protein
MEPAIGIRRVPLKPHQLVDPVTAADDLFVIAHLGVPRVDPRRWTLTIDGPGPVGSGAKAKLVAAAG